MQCRGQVEGGVTQALGAALHEIVRIDPRPAPSATRPSAATTSPVGPTPRTEVLFADTHDAFGPLGAKSMSESPFNPVAAALANADHQRHRRPLHRAALHRGFGVGGFVWQRNEPGGQADAAAARP